MFPSSIIATESIRRIIEDPRRVLQIFFFMVLSLTP
jgi:hypothetical protein